MGLTTSAPSSRLRTRLPAGLAALVLLMGLVITGTVALTLYLLGTVGPRTAAPSPSPSPYRVLFRQNAEIHTVGADAAPRRSAVLPADVPSADTTFSLASSGGEALLISGVGDFHGWILNTPTGPALPLPIPPFSLGAGPWREIAVAWSAGRTPFVLLASGPAQSPRAVVGRFTVNAKGHIKAGWASLGILPGQPLALSPKATAIALLETRPAVGDFAAQYLVRLQQLDGSEIKVAWRVVGNQPPKALLWAPDGGTVVVVEHGLAIQKSSGRVVRRVSDGALPVSFSPNGDSVAYLSGKPGAWQIHVLRLHGEFDHPFAVPDQKSPRWLGWTPDGRAVLYVSGATLWQIGPDNGTAVRVAAGLPGIPVGVAPAGTPFTR
jgi:WD40 repeat protein